MEWFFQLFWLLLIISAMQPWIQQKMLTEMRLRVMQRLERKRKSRVIALIHRQETMSFLGFPIMRFINIDDSEEVLRAIRMTPPDMPIDFIIHTPGGLVLAAEQIARALNKHPAKVTVFIPHYAMSGGTLIALAADEIVMDENAVLGPLDPQIGNCPAVSLLKLLERKDINHIDDQTLIMADIAEKAINQVRRTIIDLLKDNMPLEKAESIAVALTEGRWTHDYPITVEEARALGLPVSTDMPEEVYELMSLYPQPIQRRPSVQYVPLPYHAEQPTQPKPTRAWWQWW
ncbi:SDH family Clp fold serine proteinase [Fervidibacter sacchari]|jgi:Periplasmic serine proteases (ClpP class)|uniref:ClpP class serine protease n=1 Tax=Candidatus Fervidibacter sacchari TaxID=1448929 RepID=A0ABT2ELB5_9BACT|nr:ATP-dependent Clp protease proteolytic subunit [Candidatus Fervidibacter sacchari]MCS3918732.1 ClpP class serine protease [Candidatus Fervidibacter sacchari]WKU17516.1 ATP-dependent Clp protease proteolytic subunit [Candidatus Fervidibacter sacchari]